MAEQTKQRMKKISDVTDDEWSKVNEINRKITKEFLDQAHLSEETLKQYTSSAKIFFRWVMQECDNRPLNKLKFRDALKFQNYLINLGLSSSAVKFRRSVVSSICNFVEVYWLEEEGFEHFRNIYNKQIPNVPKAAVRKKEPLNSEEFKMLVIELEKRGEWQMVAYLQTSFSTGGRRAEVAQITKDVANFKKVDGKEYYLTNEVRGKGRGKMGKRFKLVLTDEAMLAIKKWLEIRGEDECPYLFISKHRDGSITQLSKTTFNYWCSDIFAKVVGRRMHPHLIRSSKATIEAVENKRSVEAIQRLLNHNDPSTTQIYIVKDADDTLDELFG